MLWIRRLGVSVLAIVLIASLFGLSLGTSINSAFRNPDHLKTWVNESNFYSSLIAKASSDTANSLNNPKLFSELSPVIKQSVTTAFSEQQFNQDIDNVIDNNYAWLEGKISTPNFNIDVTSQKNTFASSLGNFVETQYQSLPKCTLAQLTALSSTNPLSLTCKVSTISPAQVKQAIVSDIESSNIIVKNTVITPSTIKQKNGKPYYSGFNASAAYRHLKYIPYASAIVSLICLAGIGFIALRKRTALLVTAFCFAFTGLILLVGSITTNRVGSKISSRISKHENLNSYTVPLGRLVDKIVSYLNKVDLWFAIIYLLITVAILSLFLLKRRGRVSNRRAVLQDSQPSSSKPSEEFEESLASTSHAKIQPTAPVVKSSKNNRRLIQ